MLDIRNVSVRFSGASEVGAVENVALTLAERTKTAMIGETGSGKSVLLLAILKLLPALAEITGSVMLDGTDLLKLSEKELENIRGDRIAYIPQGGGGGLDPLMRIGMQIGEPLIDHRGFSKKEAVLQSIELLRRFDLGREEAWARAYPHMLSGGMRQRAMIAMGIAAGSKVILADEPTKGLDPQRVREVADCFAGLKEETLLCVTHDINFAAAVGEYISVMYAAQQLEYAEKDAFFKQPLHPYSQAMLAAMPERGLKSNVGFAPPHGAYSVKGCRFADRCPQRSGLCDEKKPPFFDVDGHKVRCWLYADRDKRPEKNV